MQAPSGVDRWPLYSALSVCQRNSCVSCVGFLNCRRQSVVMDGPSIIHVGGESAAPEGRAASAPPGGHRPGRSSHLRAASSGSGPAGSLVAAANHAADEEADLAFAAIDTGGSSVASRIARLHRQFLQDRYMLLAGDSTGVDGRMARALLEYALGRPPTDDEFAPYAQAVEAADFKVAFDAWWGVYRTSEQLDCRLAAALRCVDGSEVREAVASNIRAPVAPEFVRPSGSAPPGPKADARHTLVTRQSFVHRHTPGITGIFGRWKRKYLEIDYAQERMNLFSNDRKNNTPVTFLFRDIQTCAPDPQNRRPNVFKVELTGQAQPSLFALENQADRDGWVQSVLTHCLVHAVYSNMGLARVKSLVSQGADVNATKNDKVQYPPVLLALNSGQIDVARFLLKEARANGACLFRWHAYQQPRVPRPVEMVKLLGECGRNDVLAVPADDVHEWTALHYLVLDGATDCIRGLLAANTLPPQAVSQVNAQGDMPIMVALKARHETAAEIAALLLPVSDILRVYVMLDSVCTM